MSFIGPRDVLTIDLTHRSASRRALADCVFHEALGGVGLAVYLIEEQQREHGRIDPLAEENPLVFAAGPFAATSVPAGNKHAVATISPLTNFLSEGLSSSHWSAALRRCGLAAIVLTGRADRWTTVIVEDGGVAFEPADALLGLSPRETTKALRAARGDRTLRVCSIGVAGERGVRFASLENDGRQAGRGGSGAVMGAKRLKAIALSGSGTVPIADPGAARDLSLALKVRTLGPKTAKYRVLGTGANMRVLQRMGQLPTRNFTSAIFAGTERVTPERARESPGTYVELRAGCAGCPVQCEHMYVRKDRERKHAAASEYESVWAFGPNCGVDDLDAVLAAIERCDEYGLDTISTGGVIGFAMECAGLGLVDAGGLGTPLRFGNGKALVPAIEAIVSRTGPGEWMSLGVRAAAERLGAPAQKLAMHVKGLEMPGYEPRALPTYALGLATCTRGACHNRAATYDLDLRNPGQALDDAQRARAAIEAEDYAIVWDSLVLCKFIRDCFDDFYDEAAQLMTAVSGLRVTAASLHEAAAAIWRRKRRINAIQGWTPEDDALPPRLFEPIADGPLAGQRIVPHDLRSLQESYEHQRRVPA